MRNRMLKIESGRQRPLFTNIFVVNVLPSAEISGNVTFDSPCMLAKNKIYYSPMFSL